MLSTFPATTLSSDGFFSNLFPAFDGGFTPWDCIEPNFSFPHEMEEEPAVSPKKSPPPEPVISNSYSGSYDSKLNFVHSSSGSDEQNWNNDNNNLNRCLHGRKRKLTASNRDRDEKKRRRMISNRESARRSRFRKQKHLENLRNQANRLKVASRDLMNRLRLTTQQCQLVQCDNERLRIESAILRQKLEAIRQILVARQLEQQFNSYSACACSNMEQNLNKYSVINHH